MKIDMKQIEALVELLESRDLAEVDLTQGRNSVRIVRRVQGAPAVVASGPAVTAVEPVVKASEPKQKGVAKVQEEALPPGHMIKSPMVGTYYTSPSPEQPEFVAVGQKVAKGDTLCLIEAMKMFNKITADKAGKVVQCLVKNGDPVEFDQPLFIIEEC
jgi:acetyl-CoA carboxylase biotin carboxyl carrier protein